MIRRWLAVGVSICAIDFLVLSPSSNVTGIESKQSCGNPPCWPELSGEIGWNNWYVTKVQVTFNGTVNELLYRINGNNWTKYSEPFIIKTEGIHLLEWTWDSGMSNVSSLEIKIDLSPPVLSNETVRRIGLFKWQFDINATDEVSGVNKVYCDWTPTIYDTEPPYQFIYFGFYWWVIFINSIFSPWNLYMTFDAWDNAGNSLDIPS